MTVMFKDGSNRWKYESVFYSSSNPVRCIILMKTTFSAQRHGSQSTPAPTRSLDYRTASPAVTKGGSSPVRFGLVAGNQSIRLL